MIVGRIPSLWPPIGGAQKGTPPGEDLYFQEKDRIFKPPWPCIDRRPQNTNSGAIAIALLLHSAHEERKATRECPYAAP